MQRTILRSYQVPRCPLSGPPATCLSRWLSLKTLIWWVLVALAAGCTGGSEEVSPDAAKSAEGQQAAEAGAGSPEAQRSTWQMDAGEKQLAGDIAFVGAGEDRIAIHLANANGVNLFLIVPDGEGIERRVESASFEVGRDRSCRLFDSEKPFTLRLEQNEGAWLRGSFQGQLACEDYSGLFVSGTFSVPDPREEE